MNYIDGNRLGICLLLLIQLVDGQRHAPPTKTNAIESTKSRQRETMTQRDRTRQAQRPGRTETLDVEKLNRLLKAVDKSWVLPKVGSREPIGSNFQYKKTCASIYKARHGACTQIGFGIMCFNYCYEQGQPLSFRCTDTSDSSYCRRSGSFDTYLAKYRHDAYKAKSFIHQMASRCFSTAICNIQAGLLNSTLIDDENFELLPTLEIVANSTGRKSSRPTLSPIVAETRSTRGRLSTTNSRIIVTRPLSTTTVRPRTRQPMTTTPSSSTGRTNIWDRFTVNHKSRVTAKYIPFWQRLLSTTATPNASITPTSVLPSTSGSEEETFEEVDEDEEETEEEVEPEEGTVIQEVTDVVETTTVAPTTMTTTTMNMIKYKYTWRPLLITAAPAPAPAIVPLATLPEYFKLAKKNQQQSMPVERPPVFWNRFQPGRWYQSIHYVTNTG